MSTLRAWSANETPDAVVGNENGPPGLVRNGRCRMHTLLQRGAVLLSLLGLVAFAALARQVQDAQAGGGTLIGGGPGGSEWFYENSGGTDNGLPVGGECDGSPGLTIDDADLGPQGDAYDNGLMVWVDGAVYAPGSLSADGPTLTAAPVSMSGLDVATEY